MEKTNTLKKIIGIALTILALAGFYLVGTALEIDVIGQFAPYLATAIIGWAVFYAEKWLGIKLDFLNSEFTKRKVVEAIIWAEGKAVEKFKIDKAIASGIAKADAAACRLMISLPGIDQVRAEELIDEYFPLVRPQIEKVWQELAEEIKAKAALKPTAKKKK